MWFEALLWSFQMFCNQFYVCLWSLIFPNVLKKMHQKGGKLDLMEPLEEPKRLARKSRAKDKIVKEKSLNGSDRSSKIQNWSLILHKCNGTKFNVFFFFKYFFITFTFKVWFEVKWSGMNLCWKLNDFGLEDLPRPRSFRSYAKKLEAYI